MKYILVQNKTTVLIGPRFWQHRFFQSELDELEVNYKLSPVESGYINIGLGGLEIFPIIGSSAPAYDSMYETLAGPFYTYNNNEATETYTKQDLPLRDMKKNLQKLVTEQRYFKEIAGTTTTAQSTTVTIDTSRDGRNIFIQKLMLMGDSETVQWKFPETWLTLTKADLLAVVTAGATYIQNQFTWEATINTSLESAVDKAALKVIDVASVRIPKAN